MSRTLYTNCRIFYSTSYYVNGDQSYVKVFSLSYKAIQEILNSNLYSFNKQKDIQDKLREYCRIEIHNLITQKGLNNFWIRLI